MDGGSVVCAGAHKRPVHPEHKKGVKKSPLLNNTRFKT
jgi:hypothetical protein